MVQNRPINSANTDFLIRSKCGDLDDSRKVCCPKTENNFIPQSLNLDVLEGNSYESGNFCLNK